ncbi:MAG: polyribonucleotide nucleotidyltransferase [Gemmatimonadetes bacterium]|jgi:polyribonucleotide nucleotidyltransferase|nr:polyribonucleotide nucleotidyltransferase [Gemmatimonadota bacterium]MBT5804650.1 polyribonucleotide nucleotidyltransferase [Gemmatimonadota bacterium]MBT6906405.1 polyribonucleotide nucleotidyltransferase [Gemmatimonadota bacterium]MBT7419295.1 polyribonucleotide nucleotidyltransferase [Gemmatimonadota bacterium]MBT7552369.1 polyribonucleotide nucleotidyltransferase [Gemmatimonadota bacterium]
MTKLEHQLGGQTLSMETGKIAKQANGAVWLQYGETVVMVTACRTNTPEDRGFLPLIVDYREKTYAGGRIPGNIFKREGRPTEKETLSARLIDHPIRPMFPKKFHYEVQIYVSIFSYDGENDADVLGLLGASAALSISDIPFAGPMGAVRVGRMNGEFVANPTHSQQEECDIEIIVCGTSDSIVSVEGGAHEVSEQDLVDALAFGHEHIKDLVIMQEKLVAEVGKEKIKIEADEVDTELVAAVGELVSDRIKEANRIPAKEERQGLIDEIRADVLEGLAERFPEGAKQIKAEIEALLKADMRGMILNEKRRIDGRALDEVREVTCESSILPRTHGSALFTRGQTQALCVATLGTKLDERMADDLKGKRFKSYYLDYNFPAYSVGEVRFERGPGRRDIGHGHLAERAIEPVIPSDESFPYTIRLVSDITESSSSSSMATVCGCSLALMDAGIPIKTAVCGTGVGLVMEGDEYELLTDIRDAEDFLGDMDLKVAGTVDGITAIQMDIKVQGLKLEILKEALDRAKEGRDKVLGIMNECLSESRDDLSRWAPRIEFIKINQSKIGAVIGPGGKTIREIEKTGATINVAEDGTITIASVEAGPAQEARRMIEGITADAEIGREYNGTVKRIMPFGAFVEILPGKEGLLHISELAHNRVEKVEDVIAEGEKIAVKVLEIDTGGKMRLSHKALLKK